MTTYAVIREIHADPQIIWDLLTDASAYPNWNPAVLGIEGTIAPGEQIKLSSGLLEPMISKSIPDMTDSFGQFADALKRTAESR